MNVFLYVDGTLPDFRRQLIGWSNKCTEYINIFYNGDINKIFDTKFGDCVAKVRELAFSSLSEYNFRGVVDESGKIQSAAIISDGYIDIDFISKQAIIIDSLTNAPWNVIEQPTQENIYKCRGAATSLIEGIIKESQSKGFSGVVKALATKRAKQFYIDLGFIETDYVRELVVTEYTAESVLEEIELKRRLQILD